MPHRQVIKPGIRNGKRNEMKRNETKLVQGRCVTVCVRARARAQQILLTTSSMLTLRMLSFHARTSVMSLSKFSRLSGSSSDESDLEQLLSQVKRKRARRCLFRSTSTPVAAFTDHVRLLATATKVSNNFTFYKQK